RDLHSFPTRRSSDLLGGLEREAARLALLHRLEHAGLDLAADRNVVRLGDRAHVAAARQLADDEPGAVADECRVDVLVRARRAPEDRKSTRLNSSHVK